MGGLGPPPPEDAGEEHGLLGGRVRLRQPRAGLRAGLDSVMLAAACPARAGERVLDLGCGPGGVFLCVLARVAGSAAVGVERDPALAALARENAALNGWAERTEVMAWEVGAGEIGAGALPPVHHAVCNPPWWPGGTEPPGERRRGATHAAGGGLDVWAGAMARALRPRGTGAMVLPAALLDAGMAALRMSGFGGVVVWPLWPRAGVAARRVVLRGRLGGRGPTTLSPGLVLHAGGGWTAEADAVLRGGAALEEAVTRQSG
ncbi:tRNA1(Val) (adenine(37)-N6)-methyltransferase [Roseomonas sp. CCTCC AB2023176]|uniref:tRNA1(Val) (adenine(37)-N6)-methyltransferase n=1 Tax=Roseomonas sp. CCTCC AB2023176 TaxID=3342640 RepID=UPI0035D53A53